MSKPYMRYIFPFIVIWILFPFDFCNESFAKDQTLTILIICTEGPNTDILIYAFPVQGWYLVSLPIFMADSSIATLFPSAIDAFSFESENYEYEPVDTLQTKTGFWLAVNEPFFDIIIGARISEFDMQSVYFISKISSINHKNT